MSGDELKSIEKNGNYWLSESNTAYHIINPNATSLNIIEANGYYSLAKGGDIYYVLDGNGNSTRLDDEDITNRLAPGNPTGPWSIIQVEATGSTMLGGEGYALLWHSPSFFYQLNNGYSASINNIFGDQNALWNTSLANLESHFRVDLDANGSTIIKANQTYRSVDINGYEHHLDDGHGSDSLILKRDNVTIDPNSNGGLNATQVEKNGDHYELLLVHANVKYDVWKVDASGNFVSSIKAKLWQDELKFGIDLNGDGDTGLVTVEAIGSVHLKHGDNTYNGAPQYYIVDSTYAPIALTNAGALVGSNGVWNATQVEESTNPSGGFEVLWANNSGKTLVWKVDATGAYENTLSLSLLQKETTFEVDLDSDGYVGILGKPFLEANGNYKLVEGGGQYHIVDDNGDSIRLTNAGALVGSNGVWNATQVEESTNPSGGFEVLWANNSGKTLVWKVDATGAYENQLSLSLLQKETTFEVDLDSDGYVGILGKPFLEANGNYKLVEGGGQYHIVDDNGDSIRLTNAGALVGSNGVWNATQVEESTNPSGGFEVLWANNSGKTLVWKVDATGAYENQLSLSLLQKETTFEVDLDSDGYVGILGKPFLEANGNYKLVEGGGQYHIVDDNGDSIKLTNAGALVGSNGVWNATQVEESTNPSGGFEVLWANNSGKTLVWKVDATGAYENHIITIFVTERNNI